MKAVITVLGKDQIGILARVSGLCAEMGVNVEEVTQNILGGTFAMIMLVDVSKCTVEYPQLVKKLEESGRENGMDIHITRQELFEAMHRI